MTLTADIPFPTEEMMRLVCGPDCPDLEGHFNWAGQLLYEMLKQEEMITPGSAFLDVGCGCGRVARFLLAAQLRSYTGFDRHRGMIQWCTDEITSRAPHFQFHCYDIKSIYDTVDGNAGKTQAQLFEFPFRDNGFDAALLASVFTHMPMAEAANYLEELFRVLTPDGKILLSVFFAEDGTPYRQDLDFHYNRSRFLALAASKGFSCRFREELHSHNWYVLTPRK